MSIELVLAVVLALILGIVIGIVFTRIFLKPKVRGSVVIDRSDPDGPYLFLELTGSISKMSKEKYVNFKVKNQNYISPK